jgi:enoyl-CoA hydratase/carnithine racemase
MSASDPRFIQVAREREIAIVTLDRPQKLNAWHSAMRKQLTGALRALNSDDAVRAIILTGAGDQAFSAGQDLGEAQRFDGPRAITWMDEWSDLYGAIRELDKPIIAALNGVAAGSAFQVALLCDLRVGHAKSRMGQPEINSGIPSVTGVWIMWEILGRALTTDLSLSGRMIEGDEAHRLGLIDRLVERDQVMTTARSIAHELGAKPPNAMRLTKGWLRELTDASFAKTEAAGKRIHEEAFASGEPQAMMARFFAERDARKPR